MNIASLTTNNRYCIGPEKNHIGDIGIYDLFLNQAACGGLKIVIKLNLGAKHRGLEGMILRLDLTKPNRWLVVTCLMIGRTIELNSKQFPGQVYRNLVTEQLFKFGCKKLLILFKC